LLSVGISGKGIQWLGCSFSWQNGMFIQLLAGTFQTPMNGLLWYGHAISTRSPVFGAVSIGCHMLIYCNAAFLSASIIDLTLGSESLPGASNGAIDT
jgi:hypothetical protein